jgi:diaminohydroxyphosphoribosylaminopyrimidine deaminase/5-amino-6-(5-phosphoribosylamino)uracil reductase
VFSEGGSAIAASLLQADLVDHLMGFTAGVVIGAEGVPGIGAMGLAQLAHAPRFDLTQVQAVGPDVMHAWVRVR